MQTTQESTGTNVNVENDEQRAANQIETKRGYSASLAVHRINVDELGVKIRLYAVEKIFGHPEKRGRTHDIVWWYGYTALGDTLEPPEHLADLFISRY